MRGLLRLLCAGLLGVGAAVLVACGNTTGLLDSGDAEALKGDLDQVAAAVADGKCRQAGQALRRARDDFAALPVDVDPRLRSKLAAGLEHIAGKVPTECVANATDTTTTPPETNTTPTTPPDTNTTTTPPETKTTPTTPPATTPPQTTTGPGSGGQTAPNP